MDLDGNRILLGMTPEQRQDFERDGFLVLPGFFKGEELERLLAAVEDVAGRVRAAKGLTDQDHFAVRNALAHHEAILDLIDHRRVLPLVVDAIGWNIQIRTSHLDYRPPYPEHIQAGEVGVGKGADHAAGYRNLVWHADLCGPYLFEAPSFDGHVPFMEIKVGYFLSDVTQPNSGAIRLVPGSYRRKPAELREMGGRVPDDQVLELNVEPGTALLWRTATWHCVTPNLGPLTRKVIYVGYHYRWLRPTDYVRQDPKLVDASSPIRRQLLGELATGGDLMGSDPLWEPASQQWIPFNWDDVPLKAWAEARAREQLAGREQGEEAR